MEIRMARITFICLARSHFKRRIRRSVRTKHLHYRPLSLSSLSTMRSTASVVTVASLPHTDTYTPYIHTSYSSVSAANAVTIFVVVEYLINTLAFINRSRQYFFILFMLSKINISNSGLYGSIF